MNEILDRLAANDPAPIAESRFLVWKGARRHLAPEDGVTRYQYDRTQGPACAIACGAATIYRNYFAPLDGRPGQIEMRQFDGLRDVGTALGQARSGGQASCV